MVPEESNHSGSNSLKQNVAKRESTKKVSKA